MSQFQNLIRSPDSPLNIQTLISVVFIDATIGVDKWIVGKCTLYIQDTKNNMSIDNMSCIFEDNYIFVENFNTSSRSFLETVTIKFRGPRDQGPIYGAKGRRPSGGGKRILSPFTGCKKTKSLK